MNLACQEILVRPVWLEEGGVKVGGGNGVTSCGALGVRKGLDFILHVLRVHMRV